MNVEEFAETMTALMDVLSPRVPQRYAEGLHMVVDDGEHWIALELLMDTLVDDRVVLSVAERDTIERLVRSGRSGNDLIAKLPGLVVGDGR